MISLEGSNCLIFATVQLTLLLKLATNAYLEIKSKSFGWNWFSSYQLIVYIEREMTTHLCTECGKSFTEEVLLLIHQTRIHDKTSYSCDECGADVIGKVSLSNHKRRHKIPAVKNLRKHKFEKCPYESEVKSNVNRRKKQVHGQKPDKVKKSWNCDKCEKKHTKYGYDRH